MEQIVTIAEDDDQDGGDPISRIVVTTIDNCADHRPEPVIRQAEMVEVVGQSAVGTVPLPEISEFRVEHRRIECSGLPPSINSVADRTGASFGVQDARLEQAPQQREFRDCAYLLVREEVEAVRSGF